MLRAVPSDLVQFIVLPWTCVWGYRMPPLTGVGSDGFVLHLFLKCNSQRACLGLKPALILRRLTRR